MEITSSQLEQLIHYYKVNKEVNESIERDPKSYPEKIRNLSEGKMKALHTVFSILDIDED